MINNSALQKWTRLEKKSLDSQFINEVINGMDCSPFEARALLDTVHKVYGDFFDCCQELAPGKAKFIVISTEDSPSKKIMDATLVNVTLTINDDTEDLVIKEKEGVIALRQHRLSRICHEAFQQGGLLTVEDLANRIFCCGERTIVRDLKTLRQKNIFIPLRSTIKDMGRTLSHRTLIIKEWVKGREYTEIARTTNHSVKAISNYVGKFKQVVALMEDGYDLHTIAFLTKISKKLAEEYIDIKAHSTIVPSRKHELDTLLKKKVEPIKKHDMLPVPREHKLYNSAHERFLKPAIENFFKTEFKKSFGPNIRSFIADELMKIFQANNRETNTIKPGQVLWNAVHKNTRAGSPNMKLVPIVLTLICDGDISKLEEGLRVSEHKQNVIARMLQEAYSQEALLSMRDLSLLLATSDSLMSKQRKNYEQKHDVVLPHVGSLQDVGRCLTHKYQIVYKCVVEKKDPVVAARETNHSIVAVDRYLNDFNRVKTLILDNKDIDYINVVTKLSYNLIEQYVEIINQYVKEQKVAV